MLHTGDLPSAIQNHLAQRRFQQEHPSPEEKAPEMNGYAARTMAAAAGFETVRMPMRQVEGLPVSERRAFLESLPSDGERLEAPIMKLVEMERLHIIRTLQFARGDRAVAAKVLGIGRTTLYRKLKEYRLAV
jgi:transcriptional regulator of acetoin/glycerol metabolism